MTRGASRLAGCAVLAAAAYAGSGCGTARERAPSAERPRATWTSHAGPYALETDVEDAEVRAAAVATLVAAARVLADFDLGAPSSPLTVRLYASEMRRAAAEGWAAGGDRFEARPAGARRRGLVASVAFPREEVLTQRARVPGLVLCDSVRIALAHEAAHLWIFAALPGEERIPSAVHEGFADWVAEQVLTGEGEGPDGTAERIFAAESLPLMAAAAAGAGIPSDEEVLTADVRTSGRPRLLTAAGWRMVRDLASRENGKEALARWLREMASGADPIDSLQNKRVDLAYEGSAEPGPMDLTAGTMLPILVGSDVTQLTGAGKRPTYVAAPLTGTSVWWLLPDGVEGPELDVSLEVECLGGGAPEFWVAFGMDSTVNGFRLALGTGGTVSLEEVDRGAPRYGPTAVVPSSALLSRRPAALRIAIREGGVTVRAGIRSVTLAFREGAKLRSGRVGFGARGGAFAIRSFEVAPVGAGGLVKR